MTLQTKTIRMHRPKILAVCAVLLFVQATIAQTNTALIQGTVTDTLGTAVGAAAITVTSLDTGALFKTRTDGAGDFRITSLAAGNYKASVRVGGFRSQEQRVSLKDAQVYTIHFKLTALRHP